MTMTGRLIKPWACKTELHTSTMHTKGVAMPRVDSRGPATSTFRLGNSRRMMGVPSTNRPTPMGKDSRAVMRRAEPVIRAAPLRSRRARAADTAGMTEAVMAAMREVGRL